MSVGKRIYLKREMPDPEIMAQFKTIPASNTADVMGRSCAMNPRIHLVSKPEDQMMVGPAYTVKCRAGDNLTLHAALNFCQEGDVLVVSNEEDDTRALMGEIMMAYLRYTKKIAGIILDGIRVAGDMEFAFLNFFNESSRNECIDCIELNFLTISCSDHSGRSVAGTETVEFSFLCFFAKSFSYASIEFFTRDRQLDSALKRIRLNFFGFCFFSRSCCGFCFFLNLFFYFGFFCHLNISFPDMPEGGLFIDWRSGASLFDRRIIAVNKGDTT